MSFVSLEAYSVMAGDESNPEIVDVEKDIVLWTNYWTPSILANALFKHIDIVSGWFYEDSNAPDYLFTVLKVRDFLFIPLWSVYTIWWKYEGRDYISGVHVIPKIGIIDGFTAYRDRNGIEHSTPIEVFFDVPHRLMTMMVPKNVIGDPISGGALTNIMGGTGVKFVSGQINAFVNYQNIASDYADGVRAYMIQF